MIAFNASIHRIESGHSESKPSLSDMRKHPAALVAANGFPTAVYMRSFSSGDFAPSTIAYATTSIAESPAISASIACFSIGHFLPWRHDQIAWLVAPACLAVA